MELVNYLAKFFRKFGKINYSISNSLFQYSNEKPSKLIKKGIERDLYRTRSNFYFWLNQNNYIDKCIIESGFFEYDLTTITNKIVKNGYYVLDIGANIGYYSILFSKLVGDEGKVLCFEPTVFYGKILEKNILENKCQNIILVKSGLSNKKQELDIFIGGSTASIHNPGNFLDETKERISLISLDDYLYENPIKKIDIIKVDIDGHEPLFFEGAWKTIEKHNPIILMEISHLHYLEAGYTAWDFYDMLIKRGYIIYHEKNLEEIKNKEDFLIKCGNFAYSTNIVISKKQIIK